MRYLFIGHRKSQRGRTLSRGGSREGAGRKPIDQMLKKEPYNTKLPRWLRLWLTRPEREESGPVMIERALRKMYKLSPPDEKKG